MKFSLLILYLINAGLYLWFSPALKLQYPNEFAAWYFGTEGLFVSVIIYMATNCKDWIDKQLIRAVSGFIFLRAILYILNYTLIFTVNARIHMMYLAIYSIIFVLPIFVSAYRHGYFKK